MKKLIVLAAIFIISNNAFSQTPAKKENVKTLLELSGTGKIAKQLMESVIASYKKTLPDVPSEFWDEVNKEIKAEAFVELVTPIYMKHFSDEDILQLITFYKSPIGKKLIEKTPLIMQDSQPVGEEFGKVISEKVIGRLTEKGYFKQ